MIRLSLSFITLFYGIAACSAAEPERDVVVYGGTSAGVTAAVQAARMGRSVVLIEPSRHVGGLTSGGLGMTDTGSNAAIGGMAREFYQRVKKHYEADSSWRQEKRSSYPYFHESQDALWRFEPHVAEKVLREMLAEANVSIIYGERLDLKNGVQRDGVRITTIRMESGREFSGKRFVDATYEGDLMAEAGVSYHVGREANAKYGESLNGVQAKHATKHQFTAQIDPYVKSGDPASGLLPGLHSSGPGEEGAEDKRVQAYCYRTCMTDDASNLVPWPKPEGYDPLRYELGLRYALAGNRVWMKPDFMPNRKTDTNNNGAFSSDNIGMNYDYPDADYATRDKILKEHETYQKGFYWFFANDPRVPEPLRKEFQKFGLAKDEFTDNGHWPHQIYVREARRMISDYVHTEHDCRRTRETPESVGMGSYNMDSHNVQRYVDAEGHARNEGDIQVSPGGPYRISYRSLRPRKEECVNLLVPVCISCSHIAYGSVRMEPVFMILGQSAATAACLSLDDNLSVQEVSYEKLRSRLLADKQVLELVAPPKPAKSSQNLDPASLKGVVVDDSHAQRIGAWVDSSSTQGFVGSGYLHDDDSEKGQKSVRFESKLPADGEYEVRLFFPALSNRAPSVPVTIVTADGDKSITVNQQKSGGNPDKSLTLGKFHFVKDKSAAVIISTQGTSGHVVADAVQFLAP